MKTNIKVVKMFIGLVNIFELNGFIIFTSIRIICKVRKTLHQNLEFDHTQFEIQEKPARKYISIQQGMKFHKTINFGGKLSFIISFLFLKHLHCCTYIYFIPLNCTIIIISFKPYALNVEYQHSY
jgi:hypothetical protein